MKTIKSETWLPVFSGYYNTVWSPDETHLLWDSNINFEDIEVDYESYYKYTAIDIVEAVETALSPFVKSITFQKVTAPKYYNFGNDSIDVQVEYYPEQLKKYCAEFRAELQVYLEDKYTSRDGFISAFSNSVEDWEESTKFFTDFSSESKGYHTLGAILDFILYNEDIREEEIFNSVEPDIDTYITIITQSVSEMSDYDQGLFLQANLHRIDFEFGYPSVLKGRCQDKAEIVGSTWEEIVIEDYKSDLIDMIGIERVRHDFTPIE
jgi:hypothetical protein